MSGAVVAIGGSEDKEGQRNVLKRMLAEARGSKVHVITTATAYPHEAQEAYEKAFSGLGVEDLAFAHIDSRAMANDEDLASRIGEADVIFFSGGDQLKLTHMFGATAVLDSIREAYKDGAVLAGTGAGAAIMTGLMINGGAAGKALHKGEVKASPGFGFIPGSVIDTRFMQRGRLARLFQMVAANPGIIGIGLDEDMAMIWRDGEFEAFGSGGLTIVDGRGVISDIFEKEMDGIFAASGFQVHILTDGDRYNADTGILSSAAPDPL